MPASDFVCCKPATLHDRAECAFLSDGTPTREIHHFDQAVRRRRLRRRGVRRTVLIVAGLRWSVDHDADLAGVRAPPRWTVADVVFRLAFTLLTARRITITHLTFASCLDVGLRESGRIDVFQWIVRDV